MCIYIYIERQREGEREREREMFRTGRHGRQRSPLSEECFCCFADAGIDRTYHVLPFQPLLWNKDITPVKSRRKQAPIYFRAGQNTTGETRT